MKGDVEVLTQCIAKEWGHRQITINVVAPGAIETDFGSGTVRNNPIVKLVIVAQTELGGAGGARRHWRRNLFAAA